MMTCIPLPLLEAVDLHHHNKAIYHMSRHHPSLPNRPQEKTLDSR